MDKLRHLKQSKVKDRIAEREFTRKRNRQALHCQIRNIENEVVVTVKKETISKKQSKMNRLKECRELRPRDNNMDKPPMFITTVPVGRYVPNPAEIKFEKMLARKNEMRAAKAKLTGKAVSENVLNENNPEEIKFEKMLARKKETSSALTIPIVKTASEKVLNENKPVAKKSAIKRRNPLIIRKLTLKTISCPDGIHIKSDEPKMVVNMDDISPIDALTPIVCSKKRTHSTPFVRQLPVDEQSVAEINNTSYIVEAKPSSVETTYGTFVLKNYSERSLKSFDDYVEIASEFKEILLNVIAFWKDFQETNINDLNDENNDLINRETGQTNLFLNKKLASFISLATIDTLTKSRQIFIADIEGYYLGMVYPTLVDLEKRFNDLKMLKDNNWQPIKTRKPNNTRTKEVFGLVEEEIANKRILRSSRLGTPTRRKSERNLKTPTHMDQCTGCTPRKSMSTPGTPKPAFGSIRKSMSSKNILNIDALNKNYKSKKATRTVSFA